MCRWLAYSGAPIYLEEVIVKPEHSLIDQAFPGGRPFLGVGPLSCGSPFLWVGPAQLPKISEKVCSKTVKTDLIGVFFMPISQF